MKYNTDEFVEWHDLDLSEKYYAFKAAIKLLQYEGKIDRKIFVYNILHNDSILRIDASDSFGDERSILQLSDKKYLEVASDSTWEDEKISTFKEFFDISNNELPKVSRLDLELSEHSNLINETAKYMNEYWFIMDNCRDIVSRYDVVLTKYGPTILTEEDPVIKRRVSKALQCLLDNSKSSGSVYTQSKMIEMFRYVDSEDFFEDYLKKPWSPM